MATSPIATISSFKRADVNFDGVLDTLSVERINERDQLKAYSGVDGKEITAFQYKRNDTEFTFEGDLSLIGLNDKTGVPYLDSIPENISITLISENAYFMFADQQAGQMTYTLIDETLRKPAPERFAEEGFTIIDEDTGEQQIIMQGLPSENEKSSSDSFTILTLPVKG